MFLTCNFHSEAPNLRMERKCRENRKKRLKISGSQPGSPVVPADRRPKRTSPSSLKSPARPCGSDASHCLEAELPLMSPEPLCVDDHLSRVLESSQHSGESLAALYSWIPPHVGHNLLHEGIYPFHVQQYEDSPNSLASSPHGSDTSSATPPQETQFSENRFWDNYAFLAGRDLTSGTTSPASNR
jgi:hypothetical protein